MMEQLVPVFHTISIPIDGSSKTCSSNHGRARVLDKERLTGELSERTQVGWGAYPDHPQAGRGLGCGAQGTDEGRGVDKMAKKRGNGEGSIYRRTDGRWVGQYLVHTAKGPKYRYLYGKTRAVVAEKLT
jgi:hypothetical protein